MCLARVSVHLAHVRNRCWPGTDQMIAATVTALLLGLAGLLLSCASRIPQRRSVAVHRIELQFVPRAPSPGISTPPHPQPARVPPALRDAARKLAKPDRTESGKAATMADAQQMDDSWALGGRRDNASGTQALVEADGAAYAPRVMRARDSAPRLEGQRVLRNMRVRDSALLARWQRATQRQVCKDLHARLLAGPDSADVILLTMQRRGCVRE